ncbi:calcium-binding protein NCS-1-like, partial [Tropilaelaps mercedesae]
MGRRIRKTLCRLLGLKSEGLTANEVAMLVEESRLHPNVIRAWYNEFIKLFPSGVACKQEFCEIGAQLLQNPLKSDPVPLLDRIFTFIAEMPVADTAMAWRNGHEDDSIRHDCWQYVVDSINGTETLGIERRRRPLSKKSTSTDRDSDYICPYITFAQLLCFLSTPLIGYVDKKLDWTFNVLAYDKPEIFWEDFQHTVSAIRQMRGSYAQNTKEELRSAFDCISRGRESIDKTRF